MKNASIRAIPSQFKVSFLAAPSDRGEEGTIQDLSYEGCRIFISTVPTPESMIEIQIKPRHGPPVFVPKAVVRWTGESAFGVKFKSVAGYESSTLARLLSVFPA
ncbi:MAG: PilZ domain-containing protein [Nitrospira sp.]|nr:PilZ domain-containing protein [Nitrospira sp.]